MEIMDDENSYYFPPSREDEFPISPGLQAEMDEISSRMLLAMDIAQKLGLNEFDNA